jgi:hypothetical protein
VSDGRINTQSPAAITSMNPPKIRTPNKKERMKKKKHLGFVKIRKKKKNKTKQ